MKFIKPLILVIILVGFLALGLFVQNKSKALGSRFQQFEQIKQTVIEKTAGLAPISQEAENQIEILSQRAQNVATQSQQVLGTTIKVNEENSSDNKPAHEKAFEYGRYIYCKQVVDDYEQQPLNSGSSPE